MTELTPTQVNALLEEVEERRRLFTTALDEVTADEAVSDDDTFVEICRRLEIVLVRPGIHSDGMGLTWCDVCGCETIANDVHVRWHERIQAATKLSYWLSELTFKHTALLGLTLTMTLEVFIDRNVEEVEPPDEDAEFDDEQWVPSGHGWIYLQGDPPGTIRARCGGPVMCAKCRGDEQHSIAVADGAAQAYYVRMQDERP